MVWMGQRFYRFRIRRDCDRSKYVPNLVKFRIIKAQQYNFLDYFLHKNLFLFLCIFLYSLPYKILHNGNLRTLRNKRR